MVSSFSCCFLWSFLTKSWFISCEPKKAGNSLSDDQLQVFCTGLDYNHTLQVLNLGLFALIISFNFLILSFDFLDKNHFTDKGIKFLTSALSKCNSIISFSMGNLICFLFQSSFVCSHLESKTDHCGDELELIILTRWLKTNYTLLDFGFPILCVSFFLFWAYSNLSLFHKTFPPCAVPRILEESGHGFETPALIWRNNAFNLSTKEQETRFAGHTLGKFWCDIHVNFISQNQWQNKFSSLCYSSFLIWWFFAFLFDKFWNLTLKMTGLSVLNDHKLWIPDSSIVKQNGVVRKNKFGAAFFLGEFVLKIGGSLKVGARADEPNLDWELFWPGQMIRGSCPKNDQIPVDLTNIPNRITPRPEQQRNNKPHRRMQHPPHNFEYSNTGKYNLHFLFIKSIV